MAKRWSFASQTVGMWRPWNSPAWPRTRGIKFAAGWGNSMSRWPETLRRSSRPRHLPLHSPNCAKRRATFPRGRRCLRPWWSAKFQNRRHHHKLRRRRRRLLFSTRNRRHHFLRRLHWSRYFQPWNRRSSLFPRPRHQHNSRKPHHLLRRHRGCLPLSRHNRQHQFLRRLHRQQHSR
jgi:hypothetical protein